MVTEVFEDLRKAILEYDDELAANSAKKVVEEGMDSLEAFDVMTEAIRQVGDAFNKGEVFLPELISAGEALSSATTVLEEDLKKKAIKRETMGLVAAGTVLGDIHTIGKSMVVSMLTAGGFTVYDLGYNIKPEEFVEAVKVHNADILAMSSLMTTTSPEIKKTIAILEREGLRDKVKVMVGGGAISQAFADSIGADGYAPTAPGAVKLARRLLGR